LAYRNRSKGFLNCELSYCDKEERPWKLDTKRKCPTMTKLKFIERDLLIKKASNQSNPPDLQDW